jgi:hypothetical protein
MERWRRDHAVLGRATQWRGAIVPPEPNLAGCQPIGEACTPGSPPRGEAARP